MLTSGFLCFGGGLSVMYLTYNPLAWLALLLGSATFGIAIRLKKLIG